ncbi:hypothetical protein K2Q08_03100 [Patescibacteria group bacterium]|nr:hypothetical protein [Patescibacteria group bacterium]
MKTAILAMLLAVASVPGLTHAAASIPAGFAPGPIWLSQSAPIEGTNLYLNTVVYDGGATALEGTVSFLVDGKSIGSTTFALSSGESSIKSVAWVAVPGTHTVSAEITSILDSATKATTSIASASTTALSVHVTPLPPKPVTPPATTTPITEATSSAPLVQDIFAKTSTITESIRTAGESYLTKLAAAPTAATSTARKGSVLGAETHATDTEATTAPEPGLGSKVASVLLPIFKYPALFYPFFLFLLLFVLWLIAKRLRNPSRGK